MTTRNEALKAAQSIYATVFFNTLDFMQDEQAEPPAFEVERSEAGTCKVTSATFDAEVFNLKYPEGRAAWKAAAPTSCERVTVEDGYTYAQCLANWLVPYFMDASEVYLERTGCE